MRIFLSYSSSDVDIAEKIYFSLVNEKYKVFFDKRSLPVSENYIRNIRNKISKTDILVFLVSLRSVREGSYTLSELKLFERKFPIPELRVLPVVIQDTPIAKIPNYLKSVTLLTPIGNIPAEVVEDLNNLVVKLKEKYPIALKLKLFIYNNVKKIFLIFFTVLIITYVQVSNRHKDSVDVTFEPYNGKIYIGDELINIINDNNEDCISINDSLASWLYKPCQVIDIKNDLIENIEICSESSLSFTGVNSIEVIKGIVKKINCVQLEKNNNNKSSLILDKSKATIKKDAISCNCSF